ncbi:MAG: NAD(P)-dependent oxidoreductase [Armatimonadota bacterium]|nr:NAD(P)-dependent oxidoreductase [Armatimonadota bacterium]
MDEITSVEQLEEMISRPTPGVVETLAALDGDLIVLGCGGKMGPSLARMAKRAFEEAGKNRRVIGVDLFPSPEQSNKLEQVGVETIKCDLLDETQLNSLPDAPNVVYMVGMKFGSSENQALTWALNAYLPGQVCRKFSNSRITAFSTGNVYGLVPVWSGGSVETDEPKPEGEYAWSALARERVFEHFSRSCGTPVSIVRLNYSNELRYGVLVDIAQKVWAGEPVDVTMGTANVIWQADANAMALQTLAKASSPPFVVNIAGPEIISVRRTAELFGELMGRRPIFTGAEAPDALLSNGQLGHKLFGYPRVPVRRLIEWIAAWIMSGGETLGKPTHFETRDGKF